MRRIDTDDPADRWRYRCPHGHAGSSIRPTNNHWHCVRCSKASRHDPSINPEFEALVDERTGERLERDDVKLVSDDPVGVAQS